MADKYRFTEDEAPVGKELYVIPTGDWRTRRPVIDAAKCRGCGLCTMYCPVGCISKRDDSYTIDLAYCKGCGVCAEECPLKAIHLVDEGAAGNVRN